MPELIRIRMGSNGTDGNGYYRLEGLAEGPPVVLVHGFSTPLYNWDHTVPALTRAGFQVLRYDLYLKNRWYTGVISGPL